MSDNSALTPINEQTRQAFLSELNGLGGDDYGNFWESIGLKWVNLKVGSTGGKVKDVERYIAAWQGNAPRVTGVYSSHLADAVRLFQSQSGLPSTGVVDKNTWNALKSVGGGSTGSGGGGDTSFMQQVMGLTMAIGGGQQQSTLGTGVGAEEEGWGMGWYLAGGVLVLGVVGAGIYFATRE